MSLLIRINRFSAIRNFFLQSQRNVRSISTSQKKSDTATITTEKNVDVAETAQNKNWVSYGWEVNDKERDEAGMRSSFFFSVTLCLVFGSFLWIYNPDGLMKDWAQREAFLELRRREAAGLPAVNPDYIDPALISLPSDEELGDEEVII